MPNVDIVCFLKLLSYILYIFKKAIHFEWSKNKNIFLLYIFKMDRFLKNIKNLSKAFLKTEYVYIKRLLY